METYVEILKPVLEATKEFSQENIPTFSMVNPIIYTIETKLNNCIVKNSNTAAELGFTRSLKKSISNRFQVCKNNPAYLLATAIDPRFKTILMESYEVENVKRLLTTEVESLNLTSDTELETTEQNIQPIPVPTNSLWDILQERSTSSTGNKGLTNCVKNEVRSLLAYLINSRY